MAQATRTEDPGRNLSDLGPRRMGCARLDSGFLGRSRVPLQPSDRLLDPLAAGLGHGVDLPGRELTVAVGVEAGEPVLERLGDHETVGPEPRSRSRPELP